MTTTARVLVTGATGHLGANLVRALLARGHQVRALVRTNTRPLDGLELERVRGDLRDPTSLRRALREVDTVYNLAGAITLSRRYDPELDAINIAGVGNIAAAALTCGVRRVVHCSSVRVYEDDTSAPIDEQTATRTSSRPSIYGHSKARGERCLQRFATRGLDIVIVNPTGILGPYDFGPSRMGRTFAQLARGRMRVLVTGGTNFVDARDVSRGMILAAERGESGQNYILGGHWRSLEQLGEDIGRATSTRQRRLVLPASIARACAPLAELASLALGVDPTFTRESVELLGTGRHILHDRATRSLGYQPRPLSETIRDTLAWFQRAGLVPS
jgi:dihydroflavonol-4-reductase